jgi:glutamate-1-semialdehyde 2,1-aminomutase
VLGHAHPDVVDAVRRAAQDGLSFGAPTEAEYEMAALLTRLLPSLELVRLVSSGTEATMTAIRLARGFTGRNRIVKFEGCYHGHADALLVGAGSGVATLGIPGSPGVPEEFVRLTVQAPYNDLAAVEAAFRLHGPELACVIVEPVAGNMGVVPPAPSFLSSLRETCDRHGVCLVLDEVITGFRVARGGAQELYGVAADLTTLGKTIGGGLPVGAFGGRRRFMEHVAPLGMRVSQGGTLSGNPLAMAAGFATVAPLDAAAYSELEEKGAYLARSLDHPSLTVQRVGSMMTVFFATRPVRNLADAQACDTARFARWHRAMLRRGVYLPPSQFEAFFVSLAHTRDDLDRVAAAHREALREIG